MQEQWSTAEYNSPLTASVDLYNTPCLNWKVSPYIVILEYGFEGRADSVVFQSAFDPVRYKSRATWVQQPVRLRNGQIL